LSRLEKDGYSCSVISSLQFDVVLSKNAQNEWILALLSAIPNNCIAFRISASLTESYIVSNTAPSITDLIYPAAAREFNDDNYLCKRNMPHSVLSIREMSP
jgi:hypothetical protein